MSKKTTDMKDETKVIKPVTVISEPYYDKNGELRYKETVVED